jgi:transcriptional antiterminator RfaH
MIDDASQWYAVHTKAKEEPRVESNLLAWRVETFSPKVRGNCRRPFGGAPVSVVEPLFPRYVFARFDADRMLHKIHYTRGVHSVVSFGGQPVPIDAETIEAIRSRVGADGLVRLEDQLKAGDLVTIRDGQFKGMRGVFNKRLRGSDRVMILLTTVKYQASITVDCELVRKADSAPPAAA